MSKILQRILLFFIGVPVLLFLVYIPFKAHLFLHIALCIVTILASLELYDIFSKKIALQAKFFLVSLTTLFPIIAYSAAVFSLPDFTINIVLITTTIVLVIFEIFYTNKKEDSVFVLSIERISASFFIIFYCGYLFSHISKIALLPYSQFYLVVFLAFIFGCDSFAWLFGMLFGKGNRGLFTVSKKKSIAGFVGGILGTILLGFIAKLLFPDAFPGSIYKMLILSSSMAFMAIMGDLFESILKRSAELKDSGFIVPGRGGLLDSIDSMIFTVPLYYYFILLFYGA